MTAFSVSGGSPAATQAFPLKPVTPFPSKGRHWPFMSAFSVKLLNEICSPEVKFRLEVSYLAQDSIS